MQGDGEKPEPAGSWQYKPEGGSQSTQATPAPTDFKDVSWTASEYVAHQKSFGWYVVLAFGAAAGGAAVYLLTQDWVPTVVVLVFAVGFGVIGARQPRVLHYGLDERGVRIENKFYPYTMFRSFNLVDEGALGSIILMPLKRFMMSITLYFDPNDEEKILNVLSRVLPVENRGHDPVDRFMRKVRF